MRENLIHKKVAKAMIRAIRRTVVSAVTLCFFRALVYRQIVTKWSPRKESTMPKLKTKQAQAIRPMDHQVGQLFSI
jgi:hypothetical protein